MEIVLALLIAIIGFVVLRKVLSVLFTLACVAVLAAGAYFFLLPMLL